MNNKDFLSDDLFIYWRIRPTKELNIFWENFIRENEEHRQAFNDAIEIFEQIRNQQNSLQVADEYLLQNLKSRIKKEKKRRTRIFFTSAAAVLLLTIISTFFMLHKNPGDNQPQLSSIGEIMDNSDIQLFTGNNVLEIDNNSTLNLSEKKHSAIIQNRLTEQEIDLNDSQTNRLVIPYGKRSTLILADGSKVYLNSGTKMEFPTSFSGKKREIKVEGEIFIEVTKQNNTPFIIHTSYSQITVHGTSFNVSSYSEDAKESVVLVNGLVEVKSKNSILQLQPNEMAEIENGIIQHKEVDVSDYIGWISGYMQLNRAPLNTVLKKIGRYYNIEFQYDPAIDLYNQTCSGKLFLSENLHDVLEAFSKMTYLQYDTRSDETIFIHP